MKHIIIIFICILASIVYSSQDPTMPARQFISEEDSLETNYLPIADENGKIRFEMWKKPDSEMSGGSLPNGTLLYLYTSKTPNDGFACYSKYVKDLRTVQQYNSKNLHYFIIHGWRNNYESIVNTKLKNAILENNDVNVFIVDWSEIAMLSYLVSSHSVTTVGNHLGDFINLLIKHYKLCPKAVRLIGHSLGAHIAGIAGARVNGLVDYIIGLDPARPGFTYSNLKHRLGESNAEFVQIIHTCGAKLGFGSSIGHADYFPNGGINQPGCPSGVARNTICCHSRAYEYLEESIRGGNFTARRCSNNVAYKDGKCTGGSISFLGTLDIDKTARGDYYLDTNKKPPFAK